MINFASHSFQSLEVPHPAGSFLIISCLLVIAIWFTSKKEASSMFEFRTSFTLRGVAIVFLFIGHAAQIIFNSPMFLRDGGNDAVLIFLYLSGTGTVQKYGFSRVSSTFWRNRVLKLAVPLWLSLCLFIILDYLLLGSVHKADEIVLSFLGVIFVQGNTINASAWFISFIVFSYLIFYLLSRLNIKEWQKSVLFFCIMIGISYVIRHTRLQPYLQIWIQFAIAFPFGVSVYLIYRHIQHTFISFKNGTVIIATLLLLGALLKIFRGADSALFWLIRSIIVLCCVVILSVFIEKYHIMSKVLTFLGKYSYEIFLLHFPFMVKYDFFLFRPPLYLFFFVYFGFIVVLAMVLHYLSNQVRSFFEKILALQT